jgi:hypothetical protein
MSYNIRTPVQNMPPVSNRSQLTPGPSPFVPEAHLPGGLQGNTSQNIPKLSGILGKIIAGQCPRVGATQINQVLLDARTDDAFSSRVMLNFAWNGGLLIPGARAEITIEWGVGGISFSTTTMIGSYGMWSIALHGTQFKVSLNRIIMGAVAGADIPYSMSGSVAFSDVASDEMFIGTLVQLNGATLAPGATVTFGPLLPAFTRRVKVFSINQVPFTIQTPTIVVAGGQLMDWLTIIDPVGLQLTNNSLFNTDYQFFVQFGM